MFDYLNSDLAPVLIVFGAIIVTAFLLLFIIIKIKANRRIREIENYGKPSEKRLKEILERAFSPAAVFSGVYIPYKSKDRERYTEIDAIVVLNSGVFVIELKSHNGKIINTDTRYWTQIYNDKRITFYNPIYQNETHIKVLSNIFRGEGQYSVPLYSVVTFSSSKVTFTNSYPNLVPLDELVKYIKKTGKNDAISVSQTTRLRTILRSYIRTGRVVEQRHKRYVRKHRKY